MPDELQHVAMMNKQQQSSFSSMDNAHNDALLLTTMEFKLLGEYPRIPPFSVVVVVVVVVVVTSHLSDEALVRKKAVLFGTAS